MSDKNDSLKYLKKKINEITDKMEKDMANLEMFGDYIYYKTDKSYDEASKRLHILRFMYKTISGAKEANNG